MWWYQPVCAWSAVFCLEIIGLWWYTCSFLEELQKRVTRKRLILTAHHPLWQINRIGKLLNEFVRDSLNPIALFWTGRETTTIRAPQSILSVCHLLCTFPLGVSLCAWEDQSCQAFCMKGRVFSFWGYLCFWLCSVCVRWEVPAPASLKEQGVLFVSPPCQEKWQPFRLFHRNTFICVRKAAGELRWKATGAALHRKGRLYIDFSASTT